MKGKIESGDRVIVEPLGTRELQVDDIVLVTINGEDFLHLIKNIKGSQYMIGNNHRGVNGWVGRKSIHGIVVAINP